MTDHNIRRLFWAFAIPALIVFWVAVIGGLFAMGEFDALIQIAKGE